MCPTRKIIHQSKNGILTYCRRSNLFQLVFNNLCFELYEWELDTLEKHLKTLDVAYWKEQFKGEIHQRKIPLSVGTKHFIILLSRSELAELKSLLNKSTTATTLLNAEDIGYNFIAN
jgi:hypothetical protein